MVVLYEHYRPSVPYFLQYRIGKYPVYLFISQPVSFIEYRRYESNMAERPQPFIGEAEIIALHFLLCQPHPSQHVLRTVRRYHNTVISINHSPVGITGTLGNPRAPGGAQHRVQGFRQTADRVVPAYLITGHGMDIRLAVGNNDEKIAG